MTPLSVEPCTLALFGALGDLALRKLFPALYQLDRAGLLPADTRILGLARDGGEPASHLALIAEHLRRHVAERELEESVLQRFLARLDYLSMEFGRREDYAALADKAGQAERIVAFFATPASVYGAICAGLAEAGLAERTRVVLEKPIGHDLESSREVNDAVARFFPEDRTYRIDHYLGKDTVQNLIALRFANSLFETQWNQNHISHVEITVAETVGIEGRWGYFDQAGQLRDMIQNHLLQLLCLVAMEAPVRFDAKHIRGEKVKVLEALKPITGNDVLDKTVRGQYGAGRIGGHDVPAYYFEPNIDNDSDTETFVAVKAEIDNWRWAGVPFYLRTGKRMARKRSEIIITFKQVPHLLFAKGEVNRLVISLQPEESISLQLMAKAPGKGMQLEPVELDLNLAHAFSSTRRWEAYERLLLEVMRGNQNLFVRKDEIEYAWQWCDQLIDGWQRLGEAPKPYTAGSWGRLAGFFVGHIRPAHLRRNETFWIGTE